jgi:predicted 3-demethylubiquinone-9 3-methyltransferase (glyoxalase superfamily)
MIPWPGRRGRQVLYGVSWQVTATALYRLLEDEDEVKTQRVMEAMLSMSKLEVAALQRAYANE